jgi:cytochrome P450
LGHPTDLQYPTAAEQLRLVYLSAVIKESLRLYPSVAFIPARVTAKDVVVDGYVIPKGTMLSLSVFGGHRRPADWTSPLDFNPDRFLHDGEEGSGAIESTNLLAFGYGARSCIGMNFSLIEQRVILSLLLQRYTWRLPEGSPHGEGLQLRHLNLLAPKDLYLVAEKRAI